MFRCLSDLRINGQVFRAGDLFPCPDHLALQLLESGAIEPAIEAQAVETEQLVEKKKKKKVK